MFGYVVAMYIRRDKLESSVPIFNDGTTILNTGLVIKDLEISAGSFGLKAIHDVIVGRNEMAVVV